MKRLPDVINLALLAVITFHVASCDSGTGLDGEPLTAETSAALSETVSNLFSMLSLAISEVQLGKDAALADPVGACPEGGSFSVSGSGSGNQSGFDVEIEVDFEHCNGINGSLDVEGNGSFSESGLSLDLLLDGSVARECSITFDRFREGVFINFETDETLVTLDGRYRGACSNEGFTCAFDDVEIEGDSASSRTLLEENCRLH